MSGKLQGLKGISVSSLDNTFCEKMSKNKDSICSSCYSRSMLEGLRKNCRKSWIENGKLLSKHILTFSNIPKFEKNDIVRFSPHGELINQIHCDNLFVIAITNKDTKFSLFTKRPNLVKKSIGKYGKPSNLILVCSSPKVNTVIKIPDNFDKVFTVYTKDYKEKPEINCGFKKCKECMLCYTKNKVTHINELVK